MLTIVSSCITVITDIADIVTIGVTMNKALVKDIAEALHILEKQSISLSKAEDIASVIAYHLKHLGYTIKKS